MAVRSALTGAVAALALLGLGGCERMGSPLEILASKPAAPDEFQVIARKPLQMPATVSLPEPRPGAASPLDPTPNRDAAIALLGSDARPGGGGASEGEQALLAAADAGAGDPTIRTALASDAASGAGQPYEPPLIWELFGLGGRTTPPADAIDAAAEARRLQSEGVAAAPIDPSDRPETEAAADSEQNPDLYPEIGASGPSRNKLPSSGTTPRF